MGRETVQDVNNTEKLQSRNQDGDDDFLWLWSFGSSKYLKDLARDILFVKKQESKARLKGCQKSEKVRREDMVQKSLLLYEQVDSFMQSCRNSLYELINDNTGFVESKTRFRFRIENSTIQISPKPYSVFLPLHPFLDLLKLHLKCCAKAKLVLIRACPALNEKEKSNIKILRSLSQQKTSKPSQHVKKKQCENIYRGSTAKKEVVIQEVESSQPNHSESKDSPEIEPIRRPRSHSKIKKYSEAHQSKTEHSEPASPFSFEAQSTIERDDMYMHSPDAANLNNEDSIVLTAPVDSEMVSTHKDRRSKAITIASGLGQDSDERDFFGISANCAPCVQFRVPHTSQIISDEFEDRFPHIGDLDPRVVCVFNSRDPLEQNPSTRISTFQAIGNVVSRAPKRERQVSLSCEKEPMFTEDASIRSGTSMSFGSRRLGPGIFYDPETPLDNEFSLDCCDSCLCLVFADQMADLGQTGFERIRNLNLQRLSTSSRVCRQCLSSCLLYRTPKLYCDEHMQFPEVPDVLAELNDFESTLVTPRIPFMRLRNEINPGKQFSIIGNVNNISIDLSASIKRLIELTTRGYERYFLRLKRKWEFERAYLQGIFRPGVVSRALQYLLSQELYIIDGVRLDYSLIETSLDIPTPPVRPRRSEVSEEFAYANFNYETADIVPAEGGFFRSVVMDRNGEWLTFPKIYCGKALDFGALNYKAQCISEFLRYDPRCRKNITKIFYSYMKLISIDIQQSINLFFYRKRFLSGYQARQVDSLAKIQGFVSRGDADIVLRGIPTSPKYWLDQKKNLVAMIKQLGPPSFFITLSPEENRDNELIRFLLKQAGRDENTNISTLTIAERNALIAEDPIMVVMYTNRKMTKILTQVILGQNGMFRDNPVTDFYYRIEFQKRGSPHLHLLTWNQGIDISVLEDEELVFFADKYISVSHIEGFDLRTQVHKHMVNCKGTPSDINEKCGKGFPKVICNQTQILHGFGGVEDFILERNAEEIRLYHEDLALNNEITDSLLDLDLVLNDLNLSVGDYFNAIQSTFKGKNIIMARRSNEIMMNNYNIELFEAHKSNMDIQIIMDAYGLANYITGYMLKTEFEKVKLLNEAVEEVRSSVPGYRQQLQFLREKYQNITKVSAQEAAWTLLNLPLTKCSRSFATVDTGPLSARKLILKTKDQIRTLEPESMEVFKRSVQDYYKIRPAYLENICLAEFATSYTWNEKIIDHESGNFVPRVNEIVLENGKYIQFGAARQRRILITNKIDENIRTKEYLLSQIKLYVPWRDEKVETENRNILQVYRDNLLTIELNAAMFRHNISETFDDALEQATDRYNLIAEKLQASVVHRTLNEEKQEEEFGFRVDEEPRTSQRVIRERTTQQNMLFKIPAMTIYEQSQLFNRLNEEQRKYISRFDTSLRSKRSFYHVIMGGAGTGKSFLIQAIVQKFASILNTEENKIMVAAQTGKAAFSINGCTLHKAFGIPLQVNELLPLTENSLKAFQNEYEKVKLIIIDEISLVGEKMLSYINLRLRQIFRTNDDFGGKSIICVGDFQQLRPVKDQWVFSMSTALSRAQWSKFLFFEINQIMRQRDDFAWSLMLSKIGRHHFLSLEPLEIALLESRIVPIDSVPTEAIFLCSTNAEVEETNTRKIFNLVGELHISEALDILVGADVATVQAERMLREVKRERNYMETGCLPSVLNVKLGVKYMLTKNINVFDGLVNGAVGICRHIVLSDPVESSSFPKVKRIYLEFISGNVGMILKATEDHIQQRTLDGVSSDLIGINCERVTIVREQRGRDVRLKRIQLPIVECEALTIHKAQGQTYPVVALNIQRSLSRQLLYVGLSRVPQLLNLYLFGAQRLVPARIMSMSDRQKRREMRFIEENDPVWLERKRIDRENKWLR